MTTPRRGRGAVERGNSTPSIPADYDPAAWDEITAVWWQAYEQGRREERAAAAPDPADTLLLHQLSSTCRRCALRVAAHRLEDGYPVDPGWVAAQLRDLIDLIEVEGVLDSWMGHG